MGFGIGNKFLSYILSPSKLYHEVKRRKLERQYRQQELTLGQRVIITNSEIGKHVYLGNEVFLNNSSIDSHSYVNSKTHLNFTTMGKFCSIGANVKFGLGMHPTDLISTHPAFYSNNKMFKTFADKSYFKKNREINVGNDVWVGIDAVIMEGLTIGDGAIIAAGAIVTKDVQPYEVVGGMPAKHIKYRLEKDMIKKIIDTNWWNKSEDWFEKNYKLFLDNNLFLEYFEKEND